MRIIKGEPLSDEESLAYGDRLYIGEELFELADEEDDEHCIDFEFDNVGELRSHLGISKDINICYMEIDWSPQKSKLEIDLEHILNDK